MSVCFFTELRIIAKDIHSEEQYFDTIEELETNPDYHDFVYLNFCEKSNFTKLPSILPNQLQILIFCKNQIEQLPPLPSTIRQIFGKTNRITIFPEISHCIQLEDIDLEDNFIREINTKFPPNAVRNLKMSFNPLQYINYDLLIQFRHAQREDEPDVDPDFDAPFTIEASFCKLTTIPPLPFRNSMSYDHNDIRTSSPTIVHVVDDFHDNRFPFPTFAVPVIIHPRATIPPFATMRIYNDNQNVHNSAIANSTSKSVEVILKYPLKSNVVFNEQFLIQDIFSRYKAHCSYFKRFKMFFFSFPEPFPLTTWMSDRSIHSIHGITYKKLLWHVWRIIQEHEHRFEMEKTLFDELEASMNVCFTGRFTRTVNALSGYIETIQVGISNKEQMQNRISLVLKNTTNQEEAKTLITNILDEFHITEETERKDWLQAVDDFF